MLPSNDPFLEFLIATRPSSEIDVTTIRTKNIAFSNSNINPCVAVRKVSAKIAASPVNFFASDDRVAALSPLPCYAKAYELGETAVL